MKLLTKVAFTSLLVAMPVVTCLGNSVNVEPVFMASRSVRIAVVFDRKPVPGAKVEFFTYDSSNRPRETPALVMACDEYGWLKSPLLAPGRYDVRASAGDKLQGNLQLRVSGDVGKSALAFKLVLFAQPDRFEISEKQSIPEPLREFRGVVNDPTGGLIPGARIEIYQQENGARKLITRVQSGTLNDCVENPSACSGSFFARLAPGNYVAFFASPGFRSKAVIFTIDNSGSASSTVVVLHVAPATQMTFVD